MLVDSDTIHTVSIEHCHRFCFPPTLYCEKLKHNKNIERCNNFNILLSLLINICIHMCMHMFMCVFLNHLKVSGRCYETLSLNPSEYISYR